MESDSLETRIHQQARYRREGEAMVAGWKASGLSMRAYAQQAGISERRLGLWRRRLAAERGPAVLPESSFVPVTTRSLDVSGLEVVIDERVRIAVTSETDLGLLRQTVAALQC